MTAVLNYKNKIVPMLK